MTFQQFRYLLEISKHQSISKAASALFVTQPSISKAMHDLEQELSITIFNRTNKGVIFTKEGMELLAYAKVLLEQTEAIRYRFDPSRHEERQTFAISSQHFSFVSLATASFIEQRGREHYELIVQEKTSLEVLEHVYSGKSAFGILAMSDLNAHYFARHFATKHVTFTPFETVAPHVFLRSEHPLAQCRAVSYQQLADYPYFTYQREDPLLHIAEEHIPTKNLTQAVYIGDRGTMNNLLANTNGYNIGTGCIVPRFMDDNIIAIPLQEAARLHIGYVKRNDVQLAAPLQQYLTLIKQALLDTLPRLQTLDVRATYNIDIQL